MATPEKKFIVGIDVGTSLTRVLIAEEATSGQRPKIFSLGYAESQGLRYGYITHPPSVEKGLRDVLATTEKNGWEITRAYVSLGGASLSSEISGGMVTVHQESGEVTDHDIHHALTIAEQTYLAGHTNRHILHMIPYKYRLDGIEVMGNPIGMYGKQLEVRIIFVTVSEQHFNDLVQTVTSTGVDIINVVAAPIAESVALLSHKQKTVGCALITLGHETTSLIVFDNTIPVSLQVFPIGSSDITNDLALGLQVSLEEAERIKMGHYEPRQYSKKKVEEIIQARLTDIYERIHQHLKSIKRDGLLPAGIILSGGGSILPHIDEFTKHFFKLPCTVRYPDEVFNSKRDLDASWFTAYGLCFLEDDTRVYGTKIFKQAIKETKKGIMRILREFLP